MASMNAGSGPHSYVQNSSYQRGALDVAKSFMEEEILTKFNIKDLEKNGVFIADFGCSTGHNSFPAMQIITEAISHKYESAEFHVIFNDVATNDFNTLLTSLPPNRSYHAAVVPGDFHTRLLPKSSLHFAYSSWSLHWMSQAPRAVADSGSPAWNEGQVWYPGNHKEVFDAYLDQYSKDMAAFLESRAVEMVGGGFVALLVSGVPQFWNPETDYTLPCDLNLMTSCLIHMAKKGRLSFEKLKSFNLPYYYPTPQQLKDILERSHSFSIERMEIIDNPGKHSLPSIDARAAFFRAVHERLFIDHFGDEIDIDELFDLYKKKLAASPVLVNPNNDKSIVILAMLKRKAD
ncbi:hypothetical protein ACS0TY_026044 [Phlomoides rotata]